MFTLGAGLFSREGKEGHNMLQADYHIHSLSPDAKVPMERMCEAAVLKGLTEIAVTDHYEFYAHGISRPFFHEEYLREYARSIEACRERFAGRLTIRFGLELGQLHLCPREAFEVIRGYPFDYIIGSLHKIENVDLSAMEYTARTVPQIAEAYYRHLLELSRVGEFDCLGHLDLFKRHTAKNGFADVYSRYEPVIDQILLNLVARGKGIEINTSGIRQGAGETMPGLRTLRRFVELGGQVVTVGSDAHRPEDVAAGFQAAEDMLRAAGVTAVTCFHRRVGVRRAF